MRDFRDAKAMAQTLRAALSGKSVSFTHSESQELIAKILGFRDWNVLAARIQASQPTATGFQASTSAAVPPSISARAGIPVIAMQDLVLFPQMTLSIFVGREDTRRAVEFALAGDRRVLMVAQKRDVENDPNTLESLYPVGVSASVINRQTQVDGVLKVSLSGLQRTAIIRLTNDDFLTAEVAPINEDRGQSAEAASLSRAVLEAYQIYANVDFSSVPSGPWARHGLPSIGDPSLLADTVAPLLKIGVAKMQQILETSDVVTRLETLLDLMNAGGPTGG
jgi:ATP-dependent Lon protease